MEPINLLSAKVGMFNAGFCTFMGSTKVEMDFLIGGEGKHEQNQYCVTAVLVSLWASQDNPKKIVVYAAARPDTTWNEIVTEELEGEAQTEARLNCGGRPIRYMRIGFYGNFGGVFGIA